MKKSEQPQSQGPLPWLPRCQAKCKKTGNRCRQPAMKNKRVCRYHGGKSPGAPKGNQNSLKHGLYTAKAIEDRKLIRKIISDSKEIIEMI